MLRGSRLLRFHHTGFFPTWPVLLESPTSAPPRFFLATRTERPRSGSDWQRAQLLNEMKRRVKAPLPSPSAGFTPAAAFPCLHVVVSDVHAKVHTRERSGKGDVED